jgi:thiamine pyrophosphate-dependent acetolactate synthase large subunit-like protein
VVWNNAGYGDIRRQMRLVGTTPLGVDLRPPDFCALARAYGGHGTRLEDVGDVPQLARAALQRRCPAVLEVVAKD